MMSFKVRKKLLSEKVFALTSNTDMNKGKTQKDSIGKKRKVKG